MERSFDRKLLLLKKKVVKEEVQLQWQLEKKYRIVTKAAAQLFQNQPEAGLTGHMEEIEDLFSFPEEHDCLSPYRKKGDIFLGFRFLLLQKKITWVLGCISIWHFCICLYFKIFQKYFGFLYFQSIFKKSTGGICVVAKLPWQRVP